MAIKLVWVTAQGPDSGEAVALGGQRLERLPLDADGLGSALEGFGFIEDVRGVGTAYLGDDDPGPPAEALGSRQRRTQEYVAFERARPSIEIAAFVYRVDGLTREEFQIRYRALGLRLRDLAGPAQLLCRYAQALVLGDEDGPDGFSELGFADGAALRAFLTDPWLPAILLPYEAEFVDHARSYQMLVRRTAAADVASDLLTAEASG